jgi:hypothetical protein
MFKQILTIPLALISPVVLACSFAQPTPVEFDKSKAKKGESAPAVPKVTLVSVSRGYADNTGDSCADTGVIVLSVPANAANKSLVYTFEMISGKDVDGIFYRSGPIRLNNSARLDKWIACRFQAALGKGSDA